MTYSSQIVSRPAGRGRRLAAATIAALCLSVAMIGLAITGFLHLEAQYSVFSHRPLLAELTFRLLDSGPWLAAALLLAGGLFALAYLLARRLGAWLIFLAPFAYLTVLVSIAATIWLPLQQMSQVVK